MFISIIKRHKTTVIVTNVMLITLFIISVATTNHRFVSLSATIEHTIASLRYMYGAISFIFGTYSLLKLDEFKQQDKYSYDDCHQVLAMKYKERESTEQIITFWFVNLCWFLVLCLLTIFI